MRNLSTIVTIGLLVLALPASASVPKRIFVEHFGATWCTFCRWARCALHEIEDTNGRQMIHVETHVGLGDPFTTAEATARKERYGVVGIPHVRIDGKTAVIGAQPCLQLALDYQERIDEQIEAWEGTSPVEITGHLSIQGSTATVTAVVELVDPGYVFDSHQVTLFLYEDDVFWCCGYEGADRWDEVVRMVRSRPASLTQQGAQQMVVETVDVTGFDFDHLRAVAIYEEIGGSLEVIQADDFTLFESSFPGVASVPDGSGEALFAGELANVTPYDDLINLELDDGLGWPAAFRILDDPSWHTTFTLPLLAGQEVPCWVRVQTDSVARIGAGALVARSQVTGQAEPIALKVFNGAPSVLIVDDDRAYHYDELFTEALATRGFFSDRVLVEIDANGPSASTLEGYDLVIWETGHTASTLNPSDLDLLRGYLDQGGGLFLQSMEYLSSHGTDPFTRDYLGIESYVNQWGAGSASGIASDPITAGMDFAELQWPNPNYNRVDVVHPSAGAASILREETGESIALRFERPNGSRVVFNSVLVSAFDVDAPDPSNLASLVVKTVEWITGDANPSVVPSTSSAPSAVGLIGASPNPFSPGVEIRFALSENAARQPISLFVADAAGRRVRALVDGVRNAGAHALAWDGRDDDGRYVPTGVYFATLNSADGASTLKLTRLSRD